VDAVKELDLGGREGAAPDTGPGSGARSAGRATVALPWSQLLNVSAYWLGLTAIWAGLDATILPARLKELVGDEGLGRALAITVTAGVIMPILVQPVTGAISDYTISRWGRRKPFIAIGATLDVVFLTALAAGDTLLAIVVFYVLLQFSSNFAQGPFQGYIPDLVPARQVARASGVMGLMIVAGQVLGTFIGSLGLILGKDQPAHVQMFWPTIGLGLIELTTAIVVLWRVREGREALPREGRTWRSIARSPWSLETLHQRSFVWLVTSRLFFLAGTGAILRFALIYLQRAFGQDDQAAGGTINIALLAVIVPTALAVMPAARLSDRIGRKPVIFLACTLGAAGLSLTAVAPTIPLAVLGLALVGAGAGAFLAVDWALMTDIIPKATSGRYMGISNVGTAMAGPVAAIVGGLVLDAVAASDYAASPRAAYLVGAGFFVLAALLLRPVDPTPRD
jgi:MFS family permease